MHRSADPAIADILEGEWRESHGHRFLTIDRTYAPGYRHGAAPIVDAAPGEDGWGRWLSLIDPSAGMSAVQGLACSPDPPDTPSNRLMFFDLETTGLAGGAGTYAFLVGCGWFNGASFKVRQFLLTTYGAERGLLDGLREAADGADALVTYNGKSFDLPLIETRFMFHRMAPPFGEMPHIDMLHAARRLWRSQDTCSLTDIEQSVLGYIREGDVPGYEIPSRYFHYVRTGDVRPLAAVIEHNRLDLLSLALLTTRATCLLQAGAAATHTAREALGLGRLYQRAGMLPLARVSFARAAAFTECGNHDERVAVAEALRSYALLCRRCREYDEAAAAWRRLLDLPGVPPHLIREASEALAVHHEHRLRDLGTAREFAHHALRLSSSSIRIQASHHRLARINRKLSRSSVGIFF